MKCPRCGYFNVPGVETCGQCRAPLVATPAAAEPPSFEELYPPRARDRKYADRLRAPLRRGTRRLRPVADRVRDGVAAASAVSPGRYEGKPWLIASAAALPGAGQIVQGRYVRAAQLFAAFAALAAAFLLLIRQPVSDLLLWCAVGLSVLSVRDAAEYSFPLADPDPRSEISRLRSVRLFVVSVGTVATAVYFGGLALGRWFDLWVLYTDQAAPAFRQGDGLIVRRLDDAERELRRGDVAVYFEPRTFGNVPRAERIVGLPGDVVSSQDDALLVNGVRVPRGRLPLTFETPLTPLEVTVPPGTVCVWRGVNAGQAESVPAPYLLVPAEQVQGRAVGLYRPAARRRWF